MSIAITTTPTPASIRRRWFTSRVLTRLRIVVTASSFSCAFLLLDCFFVFFAGAAFARGGHP